jgi:hypothetical protein
VGSVLAQHDSLVPLFGTMMQWERMAHNRSAIDRAPMLRLSPIPDRNRVIDITDRKRVIDRATVRCGACAVAVARQDRTFCFGGNRGCLKWRISTQRCCRHSRTGQATHSHARTHERTHTTLHRPVDLTLVDLAKRNFKICFDEIVVGVDNRSCSMRRMRVVRRNRSDATSTHVMRDMLRRAGRLRGHVGKVLAYNMQPRQGVGIQHAT